MCSAAISAQAILRFFPLGTTVRLTTMVAFSKTATALKVPLGVANPMNLPEGWYTIIVAGWKWTTEGQGITEHDVRLIVKCSGTHPDPYSPLFPDPKGYGNLRPTPCIHFF